MRSLLSTFVVFDVPISRNSVHLRASLCSILICHVVVVTTLGADAFQCRSPQSSSGTQLLANRSDGTNNLWNGIANLWDEIIEVSTYGPGERKMLKLRRERQQTMDEMDQGLNYNTQPEDVNSGSFEIGDDQAWKEAFAAAKGKSNSSEDPLDYDGYALQDLLLSKWGVPLDVDFQRIGEHVCCTVLPVVGYGSPLRSRHDTELDYLMHLQGVIEILHKYNNLKEFLNFLEATDKVPKQGTDSVPFRLNLSDEDIQNITK